MDGIEVGQEVIHSLRNSKNKGMLIKLDLEKAYDCLSWEYLGRYTISSQILREIVKWILSMVSTLVMLVMLNWNPFRSF